MNTGDGAVLEIGRNYGKERTVSTNISNAKVIRYDRLGGNCPRLGVRERAGEDFQSVYYDGSRGARWSEEAVADTHDVTILEEFSSLKEITEGAPVFLATDKQGVRWSFSRYLRTEGGFLVPTRVSPHYWMDGGLAFDESVGYWEEDIAEKIDMSTVQPLFPRE